MSYKLKLKGKTEEAFISDDALFEVNKKLANKDKNEAVEFDYFDKKYKIDFSKQEISIDGKKQDLNLPLNSEEARWINFRRNFIEFQNGGQRLKKQDYYIGFQVTIDGINHKRMVKIDKDKSEIVDKS